MGDMGEYWKDVKPFLNEQRKKHVEKMGSSSFKNVKSLGFDFKHYENNHQFAIKAPNGTVDYWGTTGTWIDRKTSKRGRGFHSLKKFLEVAAND